MVLCTEVRYQRVRLCVRLRLLMWLLFINRILCGCGCESGSKINKGAAAAAAAVQNRVKVRGVGAVTVQNVVNLRVRLLVELRNFKLNIR